MPYWSIKTALSDPTVKALPEPVRRAYGVLLLGRINETFAIYTSQEIEQLLLYLFRGMPISWIKTTIDLLTEHGFMWEYDGEIHISKPYQIETMQIDWKNAE